MKLIDLLHWKFVFLEQSCLYTSVHYFLFQARNSFSPAMTTEDSVDVFSSLSIILQDTEFPDPGFKMMELLTLAVLVPVVRGVPVILFPLLSVHNI